MRRKLQKLQKASNVMLMSAETSMLFTACCAKCHHHVRRLVLQYFVDRVNVVDNSRVTNGVFSKAQMHDDEVSRDEADEQLQRTQVFDAMPAQIVADHVAGAREEFEGGVPKRVVELRKDEEQVLDRLQEGEALRLGALAAIRAEIATILRPAVLAFCFGKCLDVHGLFVIALDDVNVYLLDFYRQLHRPFLFFVSADLLGSLYTFRAS